MPKRHERIGRRHLFAGLEQRRGLNTGEGPDKKREKRPAKEKVKR
jgi:hypothetical protein